MSSRTALPYRLDGRLLEPLDSDFDRGGEPCSPVSPAATSCGSICPREGWRWRSATARRALAASGGDVRPAALRAGVMGPGVEEVRWRDDRPKRCFSIISSG